MSDHLGWAPCASTNCPCDSHATDSHVQMLKRLPHIQPRNAPTLAGTELQGSLVRPSEKLRHVQSMALRTGQLDCVYHPACDKLALAHVSWHKTRTQHQAPQLQIRVGCATMHLLANAVPSHAHDSGSNAEPAAVCLIAIHKKWLQAQTGPLPLQLVVFQVPAKGPQSQRPLRRCDCCLYAMGAPSLCEPQFLEIGIWQVRWYCHHPLHQNQENHTGSTAQGFDTYLDCNLHAHTRRRQGRQPQAPVLTCGTMSWSLLTSPCHNWNRTTLQHLKLVITLMVVVMYDFSLIVLYST